MPRKKTIQPAPLDSFTLDDGTLVEIRNNETREIGRGADKKFNSEELDNQVLTGIFDDLLSNDVLRNRRARAAVLSDYAMAQHLLDADYDIGERTARRHGKSIREKYQIWMQLVEEYNPELHGYILRHQF